MFITPYSVIAVDFGVAYLLGVVLLLILRRNVGVEFACECEFSEGQRVRVTDGNELGVVSDVQSCGRIWVFFEHDSAHDWYTAAELARDELPALSVMPAMNQPMDPGVHQAKS